MVKPTSRHWFAVVAACLGVSLTPALRGKDSQVKELSHAIDTAALAAVGDGVDFTSNAMWRANRMCGVNCLYLIARSHQVKVNYEALAAELLSQGNLPSLRDIVDSGQNLGLDLVAVKLTPDDLRQAAMPLIAHLDVRLADGLPNGHFVVVTSASADQISYIDGTTAEVVVEPPGKFTSEWSGYAVVDGGRSKPRLISAILVIAMCVLLGTVVGRKAWR